VIAVDTNILVYCHRADSQWHAKAGAALQSLAEGHSAWMIPWPCVHEFLAVVTHPRIYNPPTPIEAALQQIDAWMESPSLTVGAEVENYWQTLRPLLLGAKIAGPAVHDARVAALCIANGADELWTADRDFSRFPQLRVRNPLLS